PGLARMGSHAQGGGVAGQTMTLSGPQTRFGFVVAAVVCLIDQASKVYLLFVHDLAAHPIRLGPFFDFVFTRNTGISYGLFQTQGPVGQWVLLAFKAGAVILLWLWLAHVKKRLTAPGPGPRHGGGVGNAIDRLAYGWVADFV